MSKKVVRIKDIAVKAGVSTGTVDRVLHNRGRVSEDAKKKVLEVLEELDYEPNILARALGNNRVYTIAALIPDYTLDSYWKAPSTGINHAGRDLRAYGAHVEQFLFNPYDAQSFIDKAKELSASNPDGILLSPIFYREVLPFLEKWKKKHIPFIFFNTQIADFGPLGYIGQDSYQSGLVAGRLLHYGREKGTVIITHIDEQTNNAAHIRKKEEGFRDFFRDKQSGNFNIVTVELSRANHDAFYQQLDDVFVKYNDITAFYVTTSKAYEIAGYLESSKKENIKIVGYDLLEKNIHYLNNGLINFLINQNPYGQGYKGISYLIDYLVFRKEVPGITYLPLDVVVKENYQYYI